MLVEQLTDFDYKLSMTPEEKNHFRIIVAGTENKFVVGVGSLLAYVLTYTEQHWYDTVMQPPTVPLNDGPKTELLSVDDLLRKPKNGNSGSGSAV